MPVVDEGTQAATLDTEHTLETNTVDGAYQCYVDCSNMVAGDRTLIRLKVKVKTSGGSVIKVMESVVIGENVASGALSPLWMSPGFLSPLQFDLTLEQTDGVAGRNYDWMVASP